jgi:hypothetical protein
MKTSDTVLDHALITGYPMAHPGPAFCCGLLFEKFPAVFVFELCGPARFINCGGYALK